MILGSGIFVEVMKNYGKIVGYIPGEFMIFLKNVRRNSSVVVLRKILRNPNEVSENLEEIFEVLFVIYLKQN